MAAPAGNLVRFLAEFDLALADLLPPQLAMFIAARNAAALVEDLEVPTGASPQPAGDATLVQHSSRPPLEAALHLGASLERDLPTDTMDVGYARSIEDVPRIFPLQWLWEDVQPAWFYTKLAQHELLLPRWRQVERLSEPAPGGTRGQEPAGQRAAAEFSRQHAYVLLDTSSTMQDHDRRGTVARGLALAFVRKGYRDGAYLNLRPFAAEVGELLSGHSRPDFSAIVRRVISVPNAGQTRIQAALEQAVHDLQNLGACRGAQIMLITDGISRLGRNPLNGETLHTFILGDLFEEEGQEGTLPTLRRWSRTFRRIWTSRFPELLAPTWEDCQAALAVLDKLREACGSDKGQRPALARVARNLRFLIDQFRRSASASALPPDVESMEARLQSAEHLLAEVEEQTAVAAAPKAVLHARSSASSLGAQDAHPKGPRTGAAAFWFSRRRGSSLGRWLCRGARRLVAWLRMVLRTRFGRD